jgi:predicted HicB family RNase H-like nuclease
MKYLKHKGYTGSIEYSEEDNLLYGKVMGIRSLISYEGETGKDLENDFKEAIDSYLSDCKILGKEPEKAFKGNFNVRIPAMLHEKAALIAMETKQSLNHFVAESIRLNVLRKN